MSRIYTNEALLADAIRGAGIRYIVYAGEPADSLLFKVLQSIAGVTMLRAIDERNAAYYAMGVALEKKEAVAVVACGGYSASNYLPAATEAFYQKIPLLMIEERSGCHGAGLPSAADAFVNVSGCVLSLPEVRCEKDCRENTVKLCHAVSVLENNICGRSPVFISFAASSQKDTAVPGVFIQGVSANTGMNVWKKKAEELANSRGAVLVLEDLENVSRETVEMFVSRFSCQLITDAAAAAADGSLSAGALIANGGGDISGIEHIITLTGTSENRVERLFRCDGKNSVRHWHVSPDGCFYDPFGCLDTVFCVNAEYFMRSVVSLCGQVSGKGKGSVKCQKNNAVGGKLAAVLGAMVKAAGSGCLQYSVRGGRDELDAVQLPENIRVLTSSSDIAGTGALSVFLGASWGEGDECYLVIDDESFYRDMNALATRNVGDNVHILLLDSGKVESIGYSGAAAGARSSAALSAWMKDTGVDFIDAAGADGAVAKMKDFARPRRGSAVLMKVNV